MTEQSKTSAELVVIKTVINFALTFTVSPVYVLIWRNRFWQRLFWTKVSGISYVQPAVYDHWPFNRLGSLKLLVDSPCRFVFNALRFFPLPPKPPFLSSSCCVAGTPMKPWQASNPPHQDKQEIAAQSSPDNKITTEFIKEIIICVYMNS